jgi:hypothetical protein
MGIEKAKYTVLEKEDGFEIRKYDPQIVAETFVEGDLEKAGNKIAMTAPVKQEMKNNRWRITFLMPAEYTLETLPEPNDTRVRLAEESGRLMVALKYSGTWSEEGYQENRVLLEEYIQKRGLTKTGEPVWARYDPPFMPWFLRRNEVLIPIEKF